MINRIIDTDLLSIQEARILMENAEHIQGTLRAFPQERLDQAVELVYQKLMDQAEDLIEMAHKETDYGNPQDEIVLFQEFLPRLYSQIKNKKLIGILDKQKDYSDVGVPKGIVVSLLPAWLLVHVTVHNVLLALKTGNPIILVRHCKAKKTTTKIYETISEALDGYFPADSVQLLEYDSCAGEAFLTDHPKVAIVVDHWRDKDYQIHASKGKTIFNGATGNNPVFIEKSAKIDRAAQEIIASKSCNCGLIPGAEESLVVETCIDREMRDALTKYGAYFLNNDEAERLSRIMFHPDGTIRKELIGKPVENLAKRAQIAIDDRVKIFVVAKEYVSRRSFFAHEKYNPVLAYYTEDNWQNSCEKCLELLLDHSDGHTLGIYSENKKVIREFMLKKPVSRIVINSCMAFAATGLHSRLPLSFTLAESGQAYGDSANLNANHFRFIREVVACKKDHCKGDLGQCKEVNKSLSNKEMGDWIIDIIKNTLIENI